MTIRAIFPHLQVWLPLHFSNVTCQNWSQSSVSSYQYNGLDDRVREVANGITATYALNRSELYLLLE